MGDMIQIDFNKINSLEAMKLLIMALNSNGQGVWIGPSNEMYGYMQQFKKDK